MLYRFLKFALGYAVRSFFREIQLRNEERVPLKGPVIFLPNHRSAFMDPIVVAAYIKRRVHFLARGESFKKPWVAKILARLNMIPIYRKDFSPDDMHKNEEIFVHCHTLLEQGGALIIFPEGASQTKPVLLPLKTGAARIAMAAEAKNDFKLGVQLVPIGINYTNPHHFQGKLFLNFGKPIQASDFKEDYLKQPFEAVHKLTDHIESELRRRIVVMDDSRWQDLNEKVEQIVHSDPAGFGIGKNPANVGWFTARRDIAGAIDYFRKEKNDILEKLELKIQQYFSILELLHLTEGTLNPLGKKQEGKLSPAQLTLYFIIGLPLFICGFLLQFIPFYFTNVLAKKIVKRTDFIGSIILVLGLVLFSINAFVLTWLLFYMTDNIWLSLSFIFVLPALGFFTFRYYIRLRRWLYRFRIRFIENRKADLMEKLKEEREALVEIFKSAHTDYLEYKIKRSAQP